MLKNFTVSVIFIILSSLRNFGVSPGHYKCKLSSVTQYPTI